jgi:hypothetical protein
MRATAQERSGPLPEEPGICFFNGIDGATGEYLLPPLPPSRLAAAARGEPRYQLPDAGSGGGAEGSARDLAAGFDAGDLGQSGWGVIFAPSVGGAEREALAPLLALRRAQASRLREARFRSLDYRPGESKMRFLARHNVVPGAATPNRMPYYLLLVGDPEEIGFEFQYQLDVQYGVGRIHFDTPEEYERYARAVVEAESGKVRRPRAAAFFAPSNPGDRPTARSCEQLAAPLAATLAAEPGGWSVRTHLAERATKRELQALLAAGDAPALLFTAGHGLCFQAGDDRQTSLQGSLVCQEWPGPGQPIDESDYFSADDLAPDARVAGMIAFHFSCFGAGTPRRDGFPVPLHGRREIAPKSFLSRLSRRLLTHPAGGALAVVGHVDRAWSWSFAGAGEDGPTLRPVFESALRRLTGGYPVGYATEFFNSCYAELSTVLDEEARSSAGDDERLAQLWTSRNDARSYAVLGDPAVRLAVAPAA